MTAANDVIFGFNAFCRRFRAEVTAKKDFLLPLLHFIVGFTRAS